MGGAQGLVCIGSSFGISTSFGLGMGFGLGMSFWSGYGFWSGYESTIPCTSQLIAHATVYKVLYAHVVLNCEGDGGFAKQVLAQCL